MAGQRHLRGLHDHHVVFGIVLMVAAGVGGFGVPGAPWRGGLARLFGVGVGLVLDEFALVFHLENVYCSEEGGRR